MNGNRIIIPMINVKETIVIPFQADTLVRYVNSYDDIRVIQIEESEAKDLLMKNAFKPVRTSFSKSEYLRLN